MVALGRCEQGWGEGGGRRIVKRRIERRWELYTKEGMVLQDGGFVPLLFPVIPVVWDAFWCFLIRGVAALIHDRVNPAPSCEVSRVSLSVS